MSVWPDPPRYTFGAMSLGARPERLETEIRLVRRVMEAGCWIHCSPTYNRGLSFMVLRCAFDEDRAHRPPVIVKIRDASPRWLRFETEDACRRLGIEAIDVAQLVAMERGPGCLTGQLAGGGGPLADELADLRRRGLIRRAVLFLDRGNAEAAATAALASPLVDGVTCYWNAVQRDCTPAAWDRLAASRVPVLALRALGGGMADPAVARLMAEAGCADAVELAFRLVAGEPMIRTSVGGTADPAHLERFLQAAAAATPLPAALHRAWDLSLRGAAGA